MAKPSRYLQFTRFTLIELLVVVSVIAVLASLLLPAISRARERATTVQCVSNLRQSLIAAHTYASDYSEFPDTYMDSRINVTPVGTGHADFRTGVINRFGASEIFTYPTMTVPGVPYALPRWLGLLNQQGYDQRVMRCNADRGTWTRNNDPTYSRPYQGFMNGSKTSAFVYFGPGVYDHDVAPQSVITRAPMGIKWLSDAPYDSVTKFPKNWNLTYKKEAGILMTCPSRTMEGDLWDDYEQTGTPYVRWSADFNLVAPHGQQWVRNYGYIDGHVLLTRQIAAESTGVIGLSSTWRNSPNGYY